MHFPTRRFKWGPRGYGRVLSAAVILTTAACPYCDNRVERVDIVPGSVTAVPDKPFEMSVRVTNRVGHLMSEDKAAEVRWKSSDGAHLDVTPDQGAHTQVRLKASATDPITLTASVDGKSGTATITRANPDLGLVMDWATAKHFDTRPTLVLVDGEAPSAWRSDSVIAFVGAGALDKFRPSTADPGEITVFSPGHALQRMKVDWGEDCDHIRMTENGNGYTGEIDVLCPRVELKLAEPVSIPVHIWTLVVAPDPASVVQVHLSEARRRLANGWTGLTLDLEAPIEVLALDQSIRLHLSAPPAERCPTTGPDKLKDQLDEAGVSYGAGKLTVVYAKAIVEPAAEDTFVPADLGGFACLRNPEIGTVVVISWQKSVQTTLAHELGHAIGPPLGHTDGMDSLDDSNLMWSYDALVPGSREIMTLGQAFRLSLDGASFNYQPPHPEPNCALQSEGAEKPCPRLSKDVIKK
jgi:hypothetical protein